MTPADTLVKAIKERIAAGIDKETIKSETVAAGHTEQIFEAAYETAAADARTEKNSIPSFVSLWVKGFEFFKKEWKYALILAIPPIIATIADAVVEGGELSTPLVAMLNTVSVLASIIHIYLIIILIGKITQPPSTDGYAAARAWAAKNWLKIAWVYLLSSLAIMGGFILLILPGLILSVLLYFSYFAYAVDGHRGMAALQESRRLFRGRFFTLLAKLVGLTAITVAVFLACMVAATGLLFLASAVGELVATTAFTVLINVAAAAITVITLQAGYHFYISAKATTSAEPKGTGVYKVMVVLGLLLPAIGIAILVFFAINQEAFSEELMMLEQSAESSQPVQFELQAVAFTATTYQLANDDSFEGVCDIIRGVSDSADDAACNDSEEAWALSVVRDGEQWCADSTGFNKKLATTLENRTACIPR